MTKDLTRTKAVKPVIYDLYTGKRVAKESRIYYPASAHEGLVRKYAKKKESKK